jgi:RNA polymerase sporulation-specific sigma factor
MPLSDKKRQPERDIDEKITQLVLLVREHDSDRAFQMLRKYLNYYIKLFSKKYRIRGCDADEIEQECLYALRYKAIEDFNSERGKFRSFAILCIKRHLFSIIKGGNQQKRRVLNESVSLDDDRSEGDNLSLSNLVTEDKPPADELIEHFETFSLRRIRLLSKLSKLEQEVCKLYLQQLSYEEIVDELKKVFPRKKYDKKAVDNSLQRLRGKSKNIKWE